MIQAIMDDARGEDERVVVPDDEEEDIIDDDADFRIIDDAEFRESVRRQIDNNEPLTTTENGRLLITDGDDVDGYIPNDLDWKNFGASLGRNTIIEEVTISLNITQMMVQAVHFFRGFALNRGIQKLDIMEVDAKSSEIFLLLVPFFTSNNAFVALEILYNRQWGDIECLLKIAFAIGQFNSLTFFSLEGDDSYGIISEGQDASYEIIEALSCHVGLKYITLKNVPIGRDACVALADILQSPQSCLKLLRLFRTEIDDEGADILSTGLVRNQTLTNLHIGSNSFTEIGWQAIFAMLKSLQCRLHCLDLMNCDLMNVDINDAVARSLTHALRCNSTLKTLSLRNVHSISNAGWRNLFAGILQGPNCMLEVLDLSYSRVEEPHSLMESLASALVGNVTLKELHVFICRFVTPIGWQPLATILRNPSSELETLDLSDNSINDDIMIEFAMTLANNTKLKRLDFKGNMSGITSIGYGAFTRILCNTSTILNTFNSNHTLEFINSSWFHKDLDTLLRINHDNGVSQAARIKIINSYFSGSDINTQTQVFTDMKLNVLPTAISWMGLNDGINGGINLLFEFLRREPLVCDTKGTSRKRKAIY